jgi:aminopeptidase
MIKGLINRNKEVVVNEQQLKKYAKLVIKTGVNLKKGQLLVIKAPIESAPFVREVMTAAYDQGASDIEVFWSDEKATKIKYMMAPDDYFDSIPSWMVEFYMSAVKKEAAFLSISASDPELMKEVDPDRMTRLQKASGKALKTYREKLMNNELVWCVVSVPTLAWAKKVFPNVSEEEAMNALWDAIFKAIRVDQLDPIVAWEEHVARLKTRMRKLNDLKLTALKYRNALGTDLTVGLPEGHLWLGGSDIMTDGHEFVANIPTEEIFTAPDFRRVDGIVYSAKPLNLNGTLVEEFNLTFKAGKIVEIAAKKGFEQLKQLISTDDGSVYLGEVALVPHDSPISNMDILFYNTLFDENAACHLAIGKAYPVCLEGGDTMDAETLKEHGINDSLVHEDFMIGTEDMCIMGVTESNEEVKIFENGNFVF